MTSSSLQFDNNIEDATSQTIFITSKHNCPNLFIELKNAIIVLVSGILTALSWYPISAQVRRVSWKWLVKEIPLKISHTHTRAYTVSCRRRFRIKSTAPSFLVRIARNHRDYKDTNPVDGIVRSNVRYPWSKYPKMDQLSASERWAIQVKLVGRRRCRVLQNKKRSRGKE